MNKPQPHNEQCERNVLGCVINYNEYYYKLVEALTPCMMYSKKHEQIFTAIASLMEEGKEADTIAVYMECQKSKYDVEAFYISELAAEARTSAFETHCQELAECYKLRQIITIGQTIQTQAMEAGADIDSITGQASTMLQALGDNPISKISSAQDAADEIREDIRQQYKQRTGISTQFAIIAERGGLRPQTLTLIAAKSAHGKSALALNISVEAAREGAPVVYYSLEMSKKELMFREVARLTRIPVNSLIKDHPRMTSDQTQAIDKALEDISHLPLYFDEKATTNIHALCQSIKTIRRKYGVRLAVVDYLQILPRNDKRGNSTEEQALAEAARLLKNTAKSEDIAIIALSQISRDQNNHEPDINHIRGSGQIFEAVDNAVFLYRPEANEGNARYNGYNANVSTKGTAQLKIAKWRNGSAGQTSIVGFKGETTEFYELESIPMAEAMPAPQDEDRPF